MWWDSVITGYTNIYTYALYIHVLYLWFTYYMTQFLLNHVETY